MEALFAHISAALLSVQAALGNSVFPLFKDPRVAIFLALLILAAGAICWAWIKFAKDIPVRRACNRLIKAIRKTKDETEFNRQFADVDKALSGVSYVRHSWSEFKETLIFPTDTDPAQVIRNTARPSDYINLSSAEHNGLHLRFFQAVPNYFVGVGLILTFIGLVAALYFATTALGVSNGAGESAAAAANSNVEGALIALQGLLNAATFKFLTSIAGIACSIFLGISYRRVAGGLERKFDAITEALEARLVFVTPESIAVDQHRELCRQSEQLERFNTDLAFSIAEELNTVLNKTLQTNLQQAITPLANTLDGMAGQFGSMNEEAIKNMLDDFKSALHGAAGTELSALATTLAEAVDQVKAIGNAMDQSQGRAKEALENAAAALERVADKMSETIATGTQESMQKMATSIDGVAATLTEALADAGQSLSGQVSGAGQEAAAALAPISSSLQTCAENINQLGQSISQQTAKQLELVGKMQPLVDATGQTAEELRDAGRPIQQAAQRMSEVTEQLAAAANSTESSNQAIQALLVSLNESRTALAQEWERYSQRFETVDKSLGETFSVLDEGLRKYHDAIQEFFVKLDTNLAGATSKLGGGIGEFRDGIEELNDVIEQHVKALNGNGTTRPQP